MERRHQDLLSQNRESFIQTVDIDNLLPYFQATNIISNDDVIKIAGLGKMESKVEMFLDILPEKGSQAFHTLCAALEIAYPHLLRTMFLGASNNQIQSVAMTTNVSLTTSSSLNTSLLPPDTDVAVTGSSRQGDAGDDKRALHPGPSIAQHTSSSSAPYSTHYTVTHAMLQSHPSSQPSSSSSPSSPFYSWPQPHITSHPHPTPMLTSASYSQQHPTSQSYPAPHSTSQPHSACNSISKSHSHHSSHHPSSHSKTHSSSHSMSKSHSSSQPPSSHHLSLSHSLPQHHQATYSAAQLVTKASVPPGGARSPAGEPTSVRSYDPSHMTAHVTPLSTYSQPLLGLPASNETAPNNTSGIGGPRSPYPSSTRPVSFHEYSSDKHGPDDRLSSDLHFLRRPQENQRTKRKSQPIMGDSMALTMAPLQDALTVKGPSEENMLVPVSSDKPAGHNIDWLKSQCDIAMNELQSMKQQLGETVKKCDQAMKEADMYRQHYNSANEMLHKLRQDNTALKAQCSDVLAAEQRLEEEVKQLRKLHEDDGAEISELRKQQWEVMSENESFEGFNIMYDTAVSRYESLKTEHDNMRKQLMDAMDAHRSSARNVELLQEEKGLLQRQVEDLTQEKNTLAKDRKLMQQHMTSAIQAAAREKTDLAREVQSTKKERDDFKQLMSDALSDKAKTTKDVVRIRGERDAMVHEYTLVMSERDSVHKEIEQLQDKLASLHKQVEKSEKERKSLQDEHTGFKLQMQNVSQERDRAVEDLKLIRLKYEGASESMRMDSTDNHNPSILESFRTDRDTVSRHRLDTEQNLGSFESALQRIDSKEMESLRKEVEKQKAELTDALREVDDSKRDRDWAFSERDKIVRERESIKALCDKLRHERDNAVSKLIEAVRDSDELKKQKNESQRELKEVKEKYESLVEKEARKNQLNSVGHNHSRDSAIDADMQEWELDTLELDLGDLNADDLGFNLVGGRGEHLRGESEVVVSQVRQESRVYGRLRTNDQVVRVNEVEVSGLEADEVEQALQRAIHHSHRTAGSTVRLVVRRKRRVSTLAIFPVHVTFQNPDRELGLSVENGVYISRILTGSAVAKEGSLAVGDRILGVNGLSVENASVVDVMRLVHETRGDGVVFNVLRYCPTPSTSLANSSSMSSAHLLTESSPEVPSLSPRSPHNSHWMSPSSESSASSSQYKVLNGAPLKSSGSQTDSLDSPRPRSPDTTSPECFPLPERKAPTSDIPSNKHRVLEKKGMYERTLNGRVFRPSATDRRERDARSKSGHPFMMVNNESCMDQSMEEEVINELNAIINQYSGGNDSGQPCDRRQRQLSHENGTWPKCRAHMDYTSPVGFHAPIRHKERPRLPADACSQVDSTTDPTSAHMPPTPPERSDSFKCSATIKHSPQSSDSTVKYSSFRSKKSPPQVTSTLGHLLPQQSSYDSSPSNYQTSQNSSPFSRSREFQPASKDDSPVGVEKVSTTLSHHYPSPLRDTEPANCEEYTRTEPTHATTDYSVVSGNQQDLLKHIPRRPIRPTSAPSRSRKDRRELANAVHGARNSSVAEFTTQKPGSLNIQPMYSPRPLPHSGGQHIPPSNGNSVNQPISPLNPLGSGTRGLSTREESYIVSPSSSASVKMPAGNYPIARLPGGGELMQYHSPVYHQIAKAGDHTSSPSPPHTHLVTSPGYSSPPPGYSSRSPPITEMETDQTVYMARGRHGHYSTTPSPSPSLHSSSTPLDVSMLSGGSDDFPYHQLQSRGLPAGRSNGVFTDVNQMDGSSTFPYHHHQRRPAMPPHYQERFRLPSSSQSTSKSSVGGGRISGTASYEAVSDRSSPISNFMPVNRTIEYHPGGPGTSQTLPKAANRQHHKPRVGQKRNIKVEKCQEPLGIQIDLGSCGGIFVSSVSENSLAARNGISVADQLLEVCGINMRNATREEAAKVLRQCGGSVSMLVQYNPDKYMLTTGSSGNSSDDELSTTPCSLRKHKKSASHHVSNDTITPETCSPQTLSPSTLSPTHSVKTGPNCSHGEDPSTFLPCEPRFVHLNKHHKHDSLGLTLAGGNAVGIFVRSVQVNSVAYVSKGVGSGDQILEVNDVSLRNMTAEQAALELAKPIEAVSMMVQYNLQKYNKIAEQPGDSLYLRAMFDRRSENDGELSFRKDNILFIDSTLHQGIIGTWRAWLVDDEGNKYQCGTIPSKDRLDEELVLKRSLSEPGDDLDLKSSRRGSGSARRSFFRRRKHQRNGSKDSREFNSFSDASINSDSVPFMEDGSVLTFERVERQDSLVCRPVFILGPHASPIINKLTSESPDRYCCCKSEIKTSLASLEAVQQEDRYINVKSLNGGKFEIISIDSVKIIMEQNCHCMLSIQPESIEVLHKRNIFPIVLFLKHKSPKQIREVRDMRFLPEKMSNKMAKELFETYQEYEQKYKRFFSDCIVGGNLAYMCCKIKQAIEKEQRKTVWIPVGSL